ncbi:hypothetical protein KZZ52_37500 [Dactylosporangium sp. AC04546]|uniref:hypothetical protein n=1 Tax=Dactylosporangium sp. AC04546 TaxID=2862460 RepID=UPI001EE08CD9|nr:hypothetical protein [Dactylosporangium sp. AC04546]WVK79661.1 hypothetical protein KZZ52_37500 [Dactylosporangium sp. AC04546]
MGAGFVDPYAAVAGTVLGESAAPRRVPGPVALPAPAATPRPVVTAWLVTLTSFAAAAIAFATVATISRGRRRAWRP